MATDLAKFAEDNGVKYFMISFTDLFGGQRAKLVPARAIADMQENGAGFAGFATWLDLTPAHPDMLAVPDPAAQFPGHLDRALEPFAFVAVTSNRYHTPFVSPGTVAVTVPAATTTLHRTLQ